MSNQRCGSPFTTEQVWEIRGAGNLKNPLTNISTCSAYHRLLPILIPHRLHLSRSNVSWPAVCLTVYPPFFSLADLTLSPVHHAAIGLVHPSRGISVRMPRYIRSVPDRSPEDCSTATDIATVFKAQTRKMDVTREGPE